MREQRRGAGDTAAAFGAARAVRQGGAQLREVPRPRRAQRDAGQDAFQVADGRRRSRNAVVAGASSKVATAWYRARRTCRGRAAAGAASGAASRPPMAVAVRSKTPARVSSGLPARLSSSSRLRRVAGSMISASIALFGESDAGAAARLSAFPGHRRAARRRRSHAKRLVGAAKAGEIPGAELVGQGARGGCRCRNARAPAVARAAPSVRESASAGPSGANSSAGRRRSSSASSASIPSSSMTLKRPADRSSQARP